MLDRLFKTFVLVLVTQVLYSCASIKEPEIVVHLPGSGPIELPETGGRPIIAYALGSGAARGFAHVGVLNALDSAGITPDLIVGTSSGSIIGVLYSSGIRGEALTRLAMDTKRDEVIDYTTSKRGWINGESLQKFVNHKLENRLLEELEIPVAVVSTDLHSGTKMVFTRGDTGIAVRAASSFPGLFKPVAIDGREYVDGGVLSPVPVDTALELGADIVIAVDVARAPSTERIIDGWIDVLNQSYLIMARAMSSAEIANADVVIRPDIGDMSLMEFDQRKVAIDAGTVAAAEVIPRIKQL
ncbi:patatin-like phospholipase family protein, partial [Pseudomonadota bacterium]